MISSFINYIKIILVFLPILLSDELHKLPVMHNDGAELFGFSTQHDAVKRSIIKC